MLSIMAAAPAIKGLKGLKKALVTNDNEGVYISLVNILGAATILFLGGLIAPIMF